MDLRTWTAPETQTPEDAKGPAVDARGSDWSHRDLGQRDLSGALLCRCNLRGSDLSQCKLEGADLRLAIYDSQTKFPDDFDHQNCGAVGPGAKLNGAFLNNADLRGVDLRKAVLMGAYLSGTDLSGAILDGTAMAGADLRHANLRGAMCRGTRFGTSQLDMADFRGADLESAALDCVESIRGADFSLCRGLDQQLEALLNRAPLELDQWNPLTRSSTRTSLESLKAKNDSSNQN
ncbi:pentapeptide repeat-containing protein [Synechococcus sp. BIOS-E4-1]|uniref:pentapeptide repeat-containing protein n=1 Tax=Synechococcus sp. BIOS-E4-1 TaxID=1400864 RepID=UPI0016478406|nr:pentapeptide repeat-containing protein [Synechococcus sp. BIOS-E4-1]